MLMFPPMYLAQNSRVLKKGHGGFQLRPPIPRFTLLVTAWGCAQGFDLVLGSDVCYSEKALPALFATAAGLLARRPAAEFWLGYVSRCAWAQSSRAPDGRLEVGALCALRRWGIACTR